MYTRYTIKHDNDEYFELNTYDLQDNNFEILSEEEIDIDNIQEVNENMRFTDYVTEVKHQRIRINELIKAVKQLNKKMENK